MAMVGWRRAGGTLIVIVALAAILAGALVTAHAPNPDVAKTSLSATRHLGNAEPISAEETPTESFSSSSVTPRAAIESAAVVVRLLSMIPLDIHCLLQVRATSNGSDSIIAQGTCDHVPSEVRLETLTASEQVSIRVVGGTGEIMGEVSDLAWKDPPIYDVPVLLKKKVLIRFFGEDGQHYAGKLYISSREENPGSSRQVVDVSPEGTRVEIQILGSPQSLTAYVPGMVPQTIQVSAVQGFPLDMDVVRVDLTGGRHAVFLVTGRDGLPLKNVRLSLSSGLSRVVGGETETVFWGADSSRANLGIWETAATDDNGRATFSGLQYATMPLRLVIEGFVIVSPTEKILTIPAGGEDWVVRIVAERT